METGVEVGGECGGNKNPVTDNGVWLNNSLELRLITTISSCQPF